jgi:large subunit ribosomal protein L7/L12
MADLEKLAEEISKLTLLEASELVKMLEVKLGVSAAAPMAMVAAPAAAGPAEAEVEEKTEFNLVLKEAGDKKIEVIKVVRKLTNLGLKEAKELVESAPAVVLEGVSKEVVEDARGQLEAAGAVTEIK